MLKPKRHRQLAEINVVPYIDVMLVLLVIFMVTAPLLFQGVDVNLPTAAAKPVLQQTQEPIILSIDVRGNYYLNIGSNPTQPVAAGNLINLVARELQAPNSKKNAAEIRQVLVKGDKEINYGKIMQAMVLLQQAGAVNLGLITQPDDKL